VQALGLKIGQSEQAAKEIHKGLWTQQDISLKWQLRSRLKS